MTSPMDIRTIILLGFNCWTLNIVGMPGQPPVFFTENKGQVSDQHHQPRPDVRFYGTQGPLNFHITDMGISYQLSRVETWRKTDPRDAYPENHGSDKVPDQIRIHRIDIAWPGCNAHGPWLTANEQKGHTNYYLEVCPDGVLDVRSYGDIVKKNIYPGIDIRYYSVKGQLKYDYLVEPYADIDVIELKVSGALVRSESNGAVRLTTPLGDVTEEPPIVFQDGKALAASWEVRENGLTFNVHGRDPSKALVIDPAIRTGGTYFGGNFTDVIHSIQPLSGNDLLIAGATASPTMIATTGTFDNTINGGFDGFIARMTGHTDRVWGTYFGGSGFDEVYDMYLRFNDRTAVTGRTSSTTGIASPAAYQGTFGGGTFDAFIVWFNNSTGQRTYGTYFGGTGDEIGNSIVSDANGAEYLAGLTTSGQSIATPGSFLTTPPNTSGNNGFLAKLDASGGLVWSTYLHGSAQGVALSSTGSIYVGGSTSITSGVTTSGTQQVVLAGGTDAYLMRFTPNGQRTWGTYCGGDREEFIRDVGVDPTGNVVVVGSTKSETGIASFGAPFYSSPNDDYNGMVVKFSAQGQRIWGRYYTGPNGETRIYSCAIDGAGSIYIGGVTSCHLDLVPLDPYFSIASSDGIQPGNPGQGVRSGFFARLDPNGERMWGSYYGGFLEDEVHAVAVTPQGRLFIAGEAQQDEFSSLDDFLLTPDAWDVTAPLNDSREGFYAIFCTTLELFVTTTDPSCAGAADGSANILTTGGGSLTTISWNPAPGGGSGAQVTGLSGGIVYQATGNSLLGTCSGSSSVTFSLTSPLPLVADIQEPDAAICYGTAAGSLDLDVSGGITPYSINWSNGESTEDITNLVAGSYSVTVTDDNGCISTAEGAVLESAPLLVTANVNDEVNGSDGSIILQVSGGVPPYTFNWSNGSSSQDLVGLAGGVYSVVVVDANDCADTLELEIDSTVGVLDVDNGPAWLVSLDGASHLLTVYADMPFNNVELLDASGRILHSNSKLGQSASMDVGSLASGAYLVRIVLDEGPHVKRLFIGR